MKTVSVLIAAVFLVTFAHNASGQIVSSTGKQEINAVAPGGQLLGFRYEVGGKMLRCGIRVRRIVYEQKFDGTGPDAKAFLFIHDLELAKNNLEYAYSENEPNNIMSGETEFKDVDFSTGHILLTVPKLPFSPPDSRYKLTLTGYFNGTMQLQKEPQGSQTIKFKAQSPTSPEQNDIKTSLLELSSKVNQMSTSEGLCSAFEKNASELLSTWEANSPKEVSAEIANLKERDWKAADRIAKMGIKARGASLALTKMLGDGLLLSPGEGPRLFGAKPFTPGRRAALALRSMGDSGVVALIFALSHDFPQTYPHEIQNRKALAYETLKDITGKGFPPEPESWIRWFTSNPDTWVVIQEEQDQSEKDIGDKSVSYFVNNPLFWCLVVAIAIGFIPKIARNYFKGQG